MRAERNEEIMTTLTHGQHKASSLCASRPYNPGWISVIIPTHNRGMFLGDAIRSAWEQNYRPIEVLVVDDASTDDTDCIVRAWETRTASDAMFNIRYVRFLNLCGPARARNVGFALCCGEFVQFLDSDDYMSPYRFRAIFEKARCKPHFVVACTAYHHVAVSGKMLWYNPALDLTSTQRIALAIRGVLWTGSPLYRKVFLERVGPWQEDLFVREDREFGVRVAIKCRAEECIVIDDPLISYRHHEAPRLSNSANIVQCSRQRLRFAFSVRRRLRGCAGGSKNRLELVRVLLIHVHAGYPYDQRYLKYIFRLCPFGITKLKIGLLLPLRAHGRFFAILLWPVFHMKVRCGAWFRKWRKCRIRR